jgi:hypothetical protein
LPENEGEKPSIHRLSAAKTDDAIPEEVETSDQEWEQLIPGMGPELEIDCYSTRSPLIKLKRSSSSAGGAAIRLLLAGVNPNSDAIRIMISVCRLAIET